MECKNGTRGKIIEFGTFVNPRTGILSAKIVYSLQTLVAHPSSGKMVNADPVITTKTFPLEKFDKVGLEPTNYESRLGEKTIEHMYDAKMLAEAWIRILENMPNFELDSEAPELITLNKFSPDKPDMLGSTFKEGNV